MKNLLLTKSESERIENLVGGVTCKLRKYRKAIEFEIKAFTGYCDTTYEVGTLFIQEDGKILIWARDRHGKKKEYKTVRGVVNFFSKEFFSCDGVDTINKMIEELRALIENEAPKEEVKEVQEEENTTNVVEFVEKEMKVGQLVEIDERLRKMTKSKMGVIVEILTNDCAKIDIQGEVFKLWKDLDFVIIDAPPISNDFKFYIYSGDRKIGYKGNLRLDDAIEIFKSAKTKEYTAIGVEDGCEAIDIFCKKEGNMWASYDLRSVTRFYYNAIIRRNSMYKICDELNYPLKKIENNFVGVA